MGMRLYSISLLLLLIWTKSSISSTEKIYTEFESLLDATNCEIIYKEKAFNLRILGKIFSIPKGYDFYGFDRGSIVFKRRPISDPIYDRKPYISLEDSVRIWSHSSSEIYFSNEKFLSFEDSQEYKKIERNNIIIYYKLKESGRTIKTTVYQAILHAKANDNELSITAGSPQLIADIVACAQDVTSSDS